MESDQQKPSLNTPLIKVVRENGPEKYASHRKREVVLEEVKKQLWLAGPLVSVNLLLYCLQMISVMFVGHLGELHLSGASMASCFAAVTGFSLLVSFYFILFFLGCVYECVHARASVRFYFILFFIYGYGSPFRFLILFSKR